MGTQLESVCGKGAGRKHLGEQGLILQRAGPLPCSGRGADGDALGLGEVPGCSAGTGPELVNVGQSFAQCRQEKCCVLGAKQGLSNKESLHIPCKIPRRA